MSGPLPLRFLCSASRAEQLPDATVELAVVGRSNVGKSSLLNALANRKDLARTSKTPGATRLINVFELVPRRERAGQPQHSGRWLVDLPGYGYAKVSESERRRWQSMIETYLTERATLEGVLLLIDGEIGPTAADLQTVEWLHHIGRPFQVVATKVDKVGPSRRDTRRRDLCTKLGLGRADVAWVSADRGIGIAELRSEVRNRLGGPDV
ncbi:MAG: ribosome biogenesis GTP-binding protein YihA/YsxC [Acidimicrobiia bacterium]